MMLIEGDLTLRHARALIRKQVRHCLSPYKGTAIWRLQFFIERLDLAGVVYRYQMAKKPDGALAEIDELICFVQDEFKDFFLLEDNLGQYELPDRREKLVCENCSAEYELSGQTRCPNCSHPNLYQIAETQLHGLAEELNLEGYDPIARNILALIQTSRIPGAYREIVTHFETFYRNLNVLAFVASGQRTREPKQHSYFQNLSNTRQWFYEHYSWDPLRELSDLEVAQLTAVFRKRHVITHRGGLKDEKYLEDAGESEDHNGEPVETSREEILRAIRLMSRLVKTAREEPILTRGS